MFSQEIKWSTLDSGCSINFQRILKPEIEKMGNVKKYVTMGTQIPKWGDQGPNLRQCSLSEYQVQIKFQMRCSIRYSSVSIIRAAKVCSGQPGCVTTGACAASTWTCWTSFWPASSSIAATASTARSATAAPARNAAACAYSTRLGTSETAEF